MHQHDTQLNQKAKSVIRKCANKTNVTPKKFKDKFIQGNDIDSTLLFWKVLYSRFPEMLDFNQVDYCHCCSKFSFYRDPNINIEWEHLM